MGLLTFNGDDYFDHVLHLKPCDSIFDVLATAETLRN